MGKTICVVNQKGGVGKTSVTIELAASLTDLDYKVLVVDLDQQSNISFYTSLSTPIKNTIWEVLNAECLTEDAIIPGKYYDFIPASKALSKSEVAFSGADAVYCLSDVLQDVKSVYDYIIIDTNPARNILLNMSYIASDGAVLVTEADKGSIEGLLEIIKDIKAMQNSRHIKTNVTIAGFVLNKMENTVMHHMAVETLKEIKEEQKLDDAFIISVRKTIKMSECKEHELPLQAYAHFSDAAMDFRRIADAISEREIK